MRERWYNRQRELSPKEFDMLVLSVGLGVGKPATELANIFGTELDSYGFVSTGSFEPVKTGMHQLTLAVEDLPLPWGLLDESPRQVQVNVRETSNVDFPLQQINQ